MAQLMKGSFMENRTQGKLFIISGPSGTGKSTLVREVIKRLNPKIAIERVVTYTARPPREGEVDGKDYHFVSHDEFKAKRKDGFFLEDTLFADKPYATPASVLDDLKLGKHCIVVPDKYGAKEMHKIVSDAVLIWVIPPNVEILKQRLCARNTETHEQMEKRLKIAKNELAEEDKNRDYKYHLVNDVFDRAVAELELIIKDELGKNA